MWHCDGRAPVAYYQDKALGRGRGHGRRGEESEKSVREKAEQWLGATKRCGGDGPAQELQTTRHGNKLGCPCRLDRLRPRRVW